MATEKEVAEVVGRAVMDKEFRQKVMTDPAGVCQSLGIDLTEEQAAAIRAIDVNKVAEAVDERISKARKPSGY